MTQEPRNPGRRRVLAWLWRVPVLAVLAGIGYGAIEFVRVIFGKSAADESPSFTVVDPVVVAPLEAFAEPWHSVAFDLDGMPAMALRLPEPVAGGVSRNDVHLTGFSRICTHQACTVSLNRDVEAIALGFNYRSDTPALVCPCHLSVFSPTDAGRAVSGPAVLPLPRVRLELRGGQVIASGLEESGTTN